MPVRRAHHRLEFVDDLQRALAGLGLVGGVGGVELAAREDFAETGAGKWWS